MGNPYTDPPSGGEAEPSLPVPAYTLFDSVSVALATLLGSPVAGAALMAVNYRRLGQAGRAVTTLAMGVAVTILAGWFGYKVPHVFSTGLAVGLLLGMRSYSQMTQGAALEQHASQGGKLGSRWVASGVGVAVLAAMLGGVFLVLWETQAVDLGSKVMIGAHDAVYYSGGATEHDARALGDKLKEMGYFTDKGVTVFLSRDPSGPVVSFTVRDGIWNDDHMVTAFEEIGAQVAALEGDGRCGCGWLTLRAR